MKIYFRLDVNVPEKNHQELLIKNGLLGIRSGKRNDRSCSSFINVFKW